MRASLRAPPSAARLQRADCAGPSAAQRRVDRAAPSAAQRRVDLSVPAGGNSAFMAGALELSHEVDGAGEPVLLLMGLGGDRHGWDLMRGDLARRHRLVLVDNRDAGTSPE